MQSRSGVGGGGGGVGGGGVGGGGVGGVVLLGGGEGNHRRDLFAGKKLTPSGPLMADAHIP